VRIAALYDIHGNLPALEAVLTEVRAADVDRIVVGGDVIPGPMAHETVSLLMDLETPADFVRGNGEREILSLLRGTGLSNSVPEAFHDAMRWVAQDLGPEQADFLSTWPLTVRMSLPDVGEVLFCHATPRDDDEIFTRTTPEQVLRPLFESAKANLVVCGHTHMQFDRYIGDIRVVNAGSVGMPFGEPGAHWLLLGSGVQLRRTEYDLVEAARRVRSVSYPKSSLFVDGYLLSRPSESDMLAVFEPLAIK
jgi:putative phosphoesterase